MTNTKTVLGLSIVAVLAISIIAISAIPLASAKPSENEPDLIAILTAEGTNDAKGHAELWFNDDGTELRYKIVLNKVDVGNEIDSEKNLKDKNAGKGLEYYVKKIHIHAAPGGVHSGEHLLNVVGPNDDSDLKISGHTFKGIWDDGDFTHDHHGMGHNSKTLTSQIDALCNENTDVNIHLNESDEYIRGQILKNTDACDDLLI